MPNYGTVSFWDTNTTWMAEAATQIDYFVTVPPADSAPSEAGAAIMNAYVDAVGHSPVMPEWAQGYWHSRNRYSSQSMLLDAAKGFHDRGVNVSVIACSYFFNDNDDHGHHPPTSEWLNFMVERHSFFPTLSLFLRWLLLPSKEEARFKKRCGASRLQS